MNGVIFEVIDASRRKIYLTKEGWKHILKEHPDLSNQIENIQETIKFPLLTKQSKYDEFVRYYYKYYKNRKCAKYLMVAVKYLNGSGFIITSFYVKNIRK